MGVKNLVAKLHPLERKVLPVLKKEKEFSQIIKKSGLKEVEVMRALQWLENKKVLKLVSDKRKFVFLDANGEKYAREGLPERKFLSVLSSKFMWLSEITKKSKLSKEEINACLGLLKSKLAIELRKEKGLMVRLGPRGKLFLVKGTPEEKFLKKKFPMSFDLVEDLDKLALDNLLKRKGFLKIDEMKEIFVELSELGKKLVDADLGKDVVSRLTTGMLKTGKWKGKKFRAYDVEINVPKIYGGKKHFVNEALEYARQIWLEMGFKEMSGDMVGTSFWVFDALFTAQDHPVREMQDTFYLGGKVEKGKLPRQELVRKIKEVHENGGKTGSKGWQYKWDKEEARRNVLRTHTTILSAQTLAILKSKDLPAKFFAVGKCFRNETLDWKHLFEFNQTEGIVIDETANFRHLFGYLKEFFKKMGFPKARFRPAFFPYTEPSIEIDVFHPIKKEWVEFGGAGILRPEVVVPLLGKDIPVLAWGPGFDRTIMEYWKIQNMRELYKNDLKQLRGMKAWLK